jgi:outer membrane immunogenic protein
MAHSTCLTGGIGFAFAALFSVSAMAAPSDEAQAPTWTSCYVVINANYNWSETTVTDTQQFLTVAAGPFAGVVVPDPNFGKKTGSLDSDGVGGGVRAGCDYQFSGSWVVGLRGDFSLNNSKGSSPHLLDPPYTLTTESQWNGALTSRIGYAFDDTLLYAIGGVAWADAKGGYSGGIAFFQPHSGSWDGRIVGLTLGGGAEYMFSKKWSGYLEYSYTDFGSESAVFSSTVFLSSRNELDTTAGDIKLGINYRF